MTDQGKPGQDQPASYEIQVQGCISERWAPWFDDMRITIEEQQFAGQPGASLPITTLSGTLMDQAALMGLLQKLYTLGVPLLLVRRKETEWTNDIGMRST